jgi:mannose-6-phosphate isomerase-like protein (cupin superfamily)
MTISATKHNSPWGTWEVLDDAENFKVKKIVVKPGGRLSYQKHFKREENWLIVQGKAEFTLDDKIQVLKTGDFVHIPLESYHRIKNISDSQDLIYIEIQRGTYFGEDDIVRKSDDYGRK